LELQRAAHTSSSFWISNLILSSVWQGHVRLPAEAGEGRDKIQLRFQKRIRQLADPEPIKR